jgi:hypothetical protein
LGQDAIAISMTLFRSLTAAPFAACTESPVTTDQVELRRQFHGVARAILADIFQKDRDIDIILQSILIFLVRRSALEEMLDRKDIDELINNGLVRQILDKSGESRFVVRLPELLAAELATELANPNLEILSPPKDLL